MKARARIRRIPATTLEAAIVKLTATPRVFVSVRFKGVLWSQQVYVLDSFSIDSIISVNGFKFIIEEITGNPSEALTFWVCRLTRKRFDPEALGWQKA